MNMKKTVVLVLAALLLMGVLFAGAASADGSISVRNATGNKDLVNVGDFVYGDYGATNGTAVLIENGTNPKMPGMWVLQLNNYHVCNNNPAMPEGFLPLIYANEKISDLTIVLNGSSTLESLLPSPRPSVLNMANGNMTIISKNHDNVNDKLRVFNSNSRFGIQPNRNLTISGVNISADAGYGAAIFSAAGQITINQGSYVVSGPIASPVNILIDSAELIDITCTSNDGKYSSKGLFSTDGDIVISNSPVKIRVKHTGSSGEYLDADAIIAKTGNVTIHNSKVELYANSTASNAMAINVSKNIVIDSSSRVTATAESAGDDKLAAGLYSDTGDITIKNKAQVTAKANFTGAFSGEGFLTGGARTVWAKNGNVTITGKNTRVDAKADGNTELASAIQAGRLDEETYEPAEKGGYLRIRDGSTVTAEISTSDEGIGNTINTMKDIDIDASKVNAKGTTNDGDGGAEIFSYLGNITISNSADVILNRDGCNAPVNGIWVQSGDLEIDSSRVTVSVKSDWGTANGLLAKTLTIKGRDPVVSVDTTGGGITSAINAADILDIQSGDISAKAKYTGGDVIFYGYGIFGRNGISISGCDRIKAIGTNASFAVYGEMSPLNFDALKNGYIFSNATNPRSEPTSYENFTKNWQIDDHEQLSSNYSSVLIKKKTTFSSSSSGSNGGATVILTETPTTAPTATPTPVATIQPVGNSTIKPTTAKPTTSKSPAPLAGLVLGLGAALVLARMRK